MGQVIPYLINNTDRYTDFKMEENLNEDVQAVAQCIPEEIIVNILSYVDASTLLKLRLCCKWWKNLIDKEVWRLKTSRQKYSSLRSVNPRHKLPWFVYYKIFVEDPFEKNLIQNHCGQGNLGGWDVLSSGGNGWRVENPPVGADILPCSEEFENLTSCFATSYHSCSKEQLIKLIDHGFTSWIMDKIQPDIHVSEWIAARFDSGCSYEMKVELLDENNVLIRDFHCREEIKQWQGREWKKVSHVFERYGSGVRFIKFYHGGMDSQFWAGHYGSKMTGACVKLSIPPHIAGYL
ncbi:hypothetical protein L9F63_005104 [Diploptera punctata]|uniref:Uncharacterized protein n=1 Tax=Diploptera punctata TaxID=6984 RepID=A0AAD8E640_DIPPU|nr:hypothetical protein L9F63_005104 [Diploptera punctata]